MKSCKGMAGPVYQKKNPICGPDECWLEHIDDSGAGRIIWSEKAMEDQGIPKALWQKFLGKASMPLEFDTGNGPVYAAQSMMALSPAIGKQEAYKLEFSPCASSMGYVVEEMDQPFFCTKGIRPFYSPDKANLKMHCPERYMI